MYQRPVFHQIYQRLKQPRLFLQIIVGPRQVGKTTLVQQLEPSLKFPFLYASADDSLTRDRAWIETQWQRGRNLCQGHSEAVLVLDEVQKISDWSSAVKSLWDADTRKKVPLKVVLLGSCPLLMGKGLTESLAGRFETLHAPHWSLTEMQDCFGFTSEDYLYWGGYPGSAVLKPDYGRWNRYIRDSLIETTVGQDILSMTRVDKPALLKRLFFLGCEYAGQVLSYTKMIGQLQEAGNTTTLAHYLDLLSQAGLLTGLQKWSTEKVRSRSSSPKLIALDCALVSAIDGRSQEALFSDSEFLGRVVENAIGAHLWNSIRGTQAELYYWNELNREVDFVLLYGKRILAIEVKSGRRQTRVSGLVEFCKRNPRAIPLVVGTGGVPLDEFLLSSPMSWFS